jgi:Arc/MetJ family transcription regulator
VSAVTPKIHLPETDQVPNFEGHVLSPYGDIIGDMEGSMRATVALDDELVRKAQELTGVTERTALLRAALKALVHLEASRRLAAVGGTEPNLEEIKRVRADNL